MGDEQPNGRATIREVYEIVGRVEDKVDGLSQRVASIESRLDSSRWTLSQFLTMFSVAVAIVLGVVGLVTRG